MTRRQPVCYRSLGVASQAETTYVKHEHRAVTSFPLAFNPRPNDLRRILLARVDPLHALAKFSERGNAQEHAIFIRLVEPRDNRRRGVALSTRTRRWY
jgi:hypothetical protein